jgi:hypothetical protein
LSVTANATRWSSCLSSTTAWADAPAYFEAFWSDSRQQKVDRGLDFSRVATGPVAVDARGQTRAGRRLAQRAREAVVLERHRVDPVRQVTQLRQCLRRLVRQLADQVRRRRRIGRDQPLRHSQLEAEQHEALLCAVMEIALKAPALRVRGRDESLARGAQVL